MFVKIFAQILDSSITKDWHVRHAFQDLLILADANGEIDMTVDSIARRTNVPLKFWKGWIGKLEAPDPESRNPADGGRRIVRLEPHRNWGWRIVNYQHYRAIASQEQRRAKTAERTRKWRDQKKSVTPSDAHVTPSDASDAMQMQMQMQKYECFDENACVGKPTQALSGDPYCKLDKEQKRIWRKIKSVVGSSAKFSTGGWVNCLKENPQLVEAWADRLRQDLDNGKVIRSRGAWLMERYNSGSFPTD